MTVEWLNMIWGNGSGAFYGAFRERCLRNPHLPINPPASWFWWQLPR